MKYYRSFKIALFLYEGFCGSCLNVPHCTHRIDTLVFFMLIWHYIILCVISNVVKCNLRSASVNRGCSLWGLNTLDASLVITWCSHLTSEEGSQQSKQSSWCHSDIITVILAQSWRKHMYIVPDRKMNCCLTLLKSCRLNLQEPLLQLMLTGLCHIRHLVSVETALVETKLIFLDTSQVVSKKDYYCFLAAEWSHLHW